MLRELVRGPVAEDVVTRAHGPVTVVRLRFDPSTVEQGNFDDRDNLKAFDLADAAVIHPAFRG